MSSKSISFHHKSLSKTRRGQFLINTAIASVLFLGASQAGATDYTASSGNVIRITDGVVTKPSSGLTPEDGVVRLHQGDTVKRTGTSSSDAIFISGETSKLKLDGVEVSSEGQYTSDASLSSLIRTHTGAAVTITGGTFESTGNRYTRGLFASDANITATNVTISSIGSQSDAVHAYRGAEIAINNSNITTTGNISHGLYSENISKVTSDPATISASDVDITTEGQSSYGAFAEKGALISLEGGSITTVGRSAHGVVSGLNSHITVDGTVIKTTNRTAYGLFAKPGKHLDDVGEIPENPQSVINATNATIITEGNSAYAVFADSGAGISLDGGSINTSGERGYGILASKNSLINVTGTTITTNGLKAHAVQAGANGSTANGLDGSVINLSQGVVISTASNDSFGLHAIDGGQINSGATITTTGINGFGAFAESHSEINLTGGTINTGGNRAHGLIANNDIMKNNVSPASKGGIINAENVAITTGGQWAHGATAEYAAKIELTGGSINTTGERGYGVLASKNSSINVTGTTITTAGPKAHAVQAGANGSTADGLDGSVINLSQGVSITTGGDDSFGLHVVDGGQINSSATITTSGTNGFGAFAESYSEINLTGGTINTTGNRAHGLIANNDIAKNNVNPAATGGVIHAENVIITTSGEWTHGAAADQGGEIVLTGGSITSLNKKGQFTQDGDGSRAYAIAATGKGSTISADGTTIRTLGQRAYGAYAEKEAQVSLSNLSIETDGFMAYGVYASGTGSVVSANNVNITTNGNVGDAAWAYAGGRLELDGGTYLVHGGKNPTAGELSNGLVAVGGSSGIDNGVINARNINITTYGEESRGFRAGALVGGVETSGQISLANSVITVTGDDGIIGNVSYGSSLDVSDSVLVSEKGAGLLLHDSASVTLEKTRLETAQESIVSNIDTSGQVQTITIDVGSTLTKNNGTLLQVFRGEDGGDGVVTLNLESGSTTHGNIYDDGQRTTGGTDVYLREGAIWSGNVHGVRSFNAAAGSDSKFEGDVEFEEKFEATGQGATFTFTGSATFKEGFSATNHNVIVFGHTPTTQTIIEKDLTLAGGSSVKGGTFAMPVIVKQNVSVDGNSIFRGIFTVLGHVENTGSTGPGNSIGQHTYGSVTWGSNHIYDVEVDKTGASDLVTVTGTAKIAGSVKLTPLDGYVVGKPYTILKAGNIEGRFNEKVDFVAPTVFLTAKLNQGPTNVQLSIDRSNVTFQSVAKTENQAAVAAALDKTAVTNKIVSAITFNSVDNAVSAFDQLSGEVHASTKSGLIETAALVQNTINTRLRTAFDGVASSDSPLLGYAASGTTTPQAQAHGMAVWGAGFGAWGRFNGNTNAVSTNTSSGGFVAGIDGALTDTWRLGAFAGYSRTAINAAARSSSSKSDNYHLGIYAGAEWENLGFRSGLNYTWHNVSANRSISFAGVTENLAASYKGGTFQAFGELGYKIEAGKAKFEPFANLSYASLRTGSFTETGSTAALSVQGNTTNVTFLTLGARAETKLDFATNGAKIHGMIGWRHAFGNVTPASTHSLAGVTAFGVSGMPIARNGAVVEAGIDFNLSRQAVLGVSYAGQFGAGSQQNGFNARFSAKF